MSTYFLYVYESHQKFGLTNRGYGYIFEKKSTLFEITSKNHKRLLICPQKWLPHESTSSCGSLDTKIIEIGPRSSENGPFELGNYWFPLISNVFPYLVYNRISIENQ